MRVRGSKILPDIHSLMYIRKVEDLRLKQEGEVKQRTIYVNQFRIDFALQKFFVKNQAVNTYSSTIDVPDSVANMKNYFVVTTPFFMVVRDTKKKIEEYCAEKWPQLMHAREYSMEDLKELQKMKAYISANITATDKRNMLIYFYEKMFIQPYDKHHVKNFTWIKVNDFDCKFWNDKPHLELNCTIYFDFREYIYQLERDGYFRIDIEKMFTQRIFEIKFLRTLPQLLLFLNMPTTNDLVVSFFDYELRRINSPFYSKMRDLSRIINIHAYPKTISYNTRIVRVHVSQISKTLLEKIWRNKGKIFAAAIGVQLLRSSRKRKKDELKKRRSKK